jgi:hypothetical protein
VHDAALHDGAGERGADGVFEPGQPVAAGDEDVADPAVAQVGGDAGPEPGRFPGRGGGRGRPPLPRYQQQPANLRALVLDAGRKTCRHVTWRHGTKRAPGNQTGAMRSRFTTLGVRPANRDIPAPQTAACPSAG